MRELPYSNYPAGVTDDDPHFNLLNARDPTHDYRFSRGWGNQEPHEPERAPDHEPDCKCEECADCPY